MNYVIFDLEWNNAYNYAKNKSVNEIIEIGAIKLDRNLNIVDTFKQLIKPRVTRKLSNRCKNLTGITMDEIKQNGISFESAFADFARWSGQDSLFLTWSNSDLYVLADNYNSVMGNCKISFIKQYCDAQKYCMSFIEEYDGHTQIGLSRCAEIFNIQFDSSKLHRALADCYLTAECLKSVYDKNKLAPYIKQCDNTFFERLIFKPYFITKPHTDEFNIRDIDFKCLKCSDNVKTLKPFENINNTFKTVGVCKSCGSKYWLSVRAKRVYDGVVVTDKVIPMNKKKAKKIDA